MDLSNKGLSLIKKHEGCKLTAYKCPAGVWTIGFGNTKYANGTPVKEGERITIKQAEDLFKEIVEEFSYSVYFLCGEYVNQNQFDALTSFAYNVGIGAFKKSTLLKLVRANANNPLIRNEFAKWNKVKGKPIKGLTNRRKEEADLYFS
jgi:lysozyme